MGGEKLVLTYFDFPGRAEATRLALSIGGIPFEDKRIKFEDWPQLKAKTPFGSLPLLEIDGKTICQSMSILNFAGRRANLVPSDAVQEAEVHMVLGALNDALTIFSTYKAEADPSKADVLAQNCRRQMPGALAAIDRVIAANVAASGWVVGSAMTIADLQIYVIGVMLEFMPLPADFDARAKIPSIMKIHDKVKENKTVVEWNRRQ